MYNNMPNFFSESTETLKDHNIHNTTFSPL